MGDKEKEQGPEPNSGSQSAAGAAPTSGNSAAQSSSHSDEHSTVVAQYWAANLRLLGILLSIWFVASFVFGILLVDVLDEFRLFGFKLGFWFAQQGSIYIFIALIFVYAFQIHKIERRFGVSDE